jgi:uncharacterized membrane protein
MTLNETSAPPPATPTSNAAEPSRALQALFLLAMAGALVGLGLWLALALDGPSLAAFVHKNELAPGARRAQLAVSVIFAGVAALAAWLWARRQPTPLYQALWQFLARTAPLSLFVFVPLLSDWRLWQSTPVAFYVLVILLGVATERLLFLRRCHPPLFAHPSRLLVRVDQALLPLPLPHDTAPGEPTPKTTAPVWRRGPFVVVLVGALGYTAYFGVYTILAHLNLRTSSYDMAIEENLVWNIVHGGPFFKTSPLAGPTSSHTGYHFTLFSYLLAPFYALYQHAESLLFLQAALIGTAAIPLYLWGRLHIGNWPAAIVAVAYLFYPPLHGSNLYDFHYPPLAPFFVWWLLYFLQVGRDRWAAVFFVIALSVREDIAAGLLVLGLHTALFGGRARAGLLITVVAGIYFSLVKFVVMPSFHGEKQTYVRYFKDMLPPGEEGYTGVIKTLVGNPAYSVQQLLTAPKIEYLLRLLAPLAFLPLRRVGGYLLLVPGILFTLVSAGYVPLLSTHFQYTAHWTLYLLPGVVLGLAHLGRRRDPHDEARIARFQGALAALVVVVLAASYQDGAVLQQHTAKAGYRPFVFGAKKGDEDRRAALARILAQLPKDARVSASERLVPHVANRQNAYTLRIGVYDAQYILFEPRALSVNERPKLERTLKRKPFGVAAEEKPFLLLERGLDPETLRAPLQRVLPDLFAGDGPARPKAGKRGRKGKKKDPAEGETQPQTLPAP